MRSTRTGKVVFDKKNKEFMGYHETPVDSLEIAYIFDCYTSDRAITDLFDKDYRENIEIWNVRVIVETLDNG
jgi:hypothetical protein